MNAIEQAEAYAQHAVELLTAERNRIDDMITRLSDKKAPAVKRGRPKKSENSSSLTSLEVVDKLRSNS